ncbi:MAG: hypothetical protein LCH41_04435 [Armatimonadetes bacterium]|nr:hypothetical protein [Armatimonadota bacterium]
MPLISLALVLSSGSHHPDLLPQWARGEWSRQDKAYSQILDDVRPFYGKDGFIDERACADKFIFHSNAFLNDPIDSILFMRALAWYEILLSDGNVGRISGMGPQLRKFRNAMRSWTKPVDSFHFTRTLAICIYRTSGHDTFAGNKLIEKLYAKNQADTELEQHYILWAAMNPEVGVNRTTLLKLLEKQEKLKFRQGSRLIFLAESYKWVAILEMPLSKSLTEKSIALRSEYISRLPPGHVRNTPEYRAEARADAKALLSYFKDR